MPLADRETARILSANPNRPSKGMLWRLSAPLKSLLAQGAARWASPQVIELVLNEEELSSGGYATIAINRPVRCSHKGEECARCEGKGEYVERVSAWVSIPAGVREGVELDSHTEPFEFVEPVRFVARHDR